jgi:hypothetical protein
MNGGKKMIRTLKKHCGLLLALCLLLSLLPMTALAIPAPPTTVTVATISELTSALAAVLPGGSSTIQLLNNINYDSNITVDGKTITFDLNSFTLNVTVETGTALTVKNRGAVSLAGSGALNVTGTSCGVQATGSSTATVTNAATSGDDSIAAYASGDGSIAIEGNVTAVGTNSIGVYSYSGNILVKGNVTADGTGAVLDSYQTTGITVYGSITAPTYITVYSYIESEDPPGVVNVTKEPRSLTYADGVAGTGTSAGFLRYSDPRIASNAVCVLKLLTVGTGGNYANITDALAVAPSGTTITLLSDVTESSEIFVSGKDITLDLNGYDLTISVAVRTALTVNDGGSVVLTGSGSLDVSSADGVGVEVHGPGSKATVTTASGGGTDLLNPTWCVGAYAWNGGAVTVTGDVSATGIEGIGVYASWGGSSVTVGGSVTASGARSIGAFADYEGTVTVNGNVSASSSDGVGTKATDVGTVTVNGNVSANIFARVGTADKTAADGTAGTDADQGYRIFSDDAGNAVRVKTPVRNVTTDTYYMTLTEALAGAAGGDTIALLSDLTETVTYTVASDKCITIDGQGHTLTNGSGMGMSTTGLSLDGTGEIILKNLTIQGSASAGVSSGLAVSGSVNVLSTGVVAAIGGSGMGYSYGVLNNGSGTVNLSEATGDTAATSCGVYNSAGGTVNVSSATGDSIIFNGYGVNNASTGTVNVGTATGTSCGVFNSGAGTVNVTTATGNKGVHNGHSQGTVNVGTATGGTPANDTDNEGGGTLNTGDDVARITLNKGTGASCVLDTVTVAAAGTPAATLPSVHKDGVLGQWFTDSAKTTLYAGGPVTDGTTLYSSFYTAPVTPSTGGGGGWSSSGTPTITTGTSGNVTTSDAALTGTTSSGLTSASVDTGTMTTLISGASGTEKVGGSAVIGITVGSASGATGAAVIIPAASFGSMAGGTSAALRITTDLGSITFDAAAVDGINTAAKGDVSIGVSTVSASSLPASVQQQVGNRPVYSFTVTSGGHTISSFGGGSATVSLPYTLKPGEDPNAVVVYYIDASGTLQAMQGAYDAATGTVSFVTSHFSEYTIGYNKLTFTDVSDTAWYSNAVTFLAARGITTGTDSGLFSPDASLTRGQFITMLLRAYGISPDSSLADNFADAGSTYYTNYLAAAKRLGISGGVGSNMFAPEQAITRQEMFTLLYNALKVLNQLPSKAPVKTLADFSDAADIASWAKDAMTLLVETGTVTGSDGKLSPAGATTRAEMAQVLYSLLRK